MYAAAAKSLQSCLTLRDPMDCSLPGSSVHGVFQARVLEWGANAFSVYTCICVYINCLPKPLVNQNIPFLKHTKKPQVFFFYNNSYS